MARKIKGKEKRIVRSVRVEQSEIDLINGKFGSIRAMVDAVIKRIKEAKNE